MTVLCPVVRPYYNPNICTITVLVRTISGTMTVLLSVLYGTSSGSSFLSWPPVGVPVPYHVLINECARARVGANAIIRTTRCARAIVRAIMPSKTSKGRELTRTDVHPSGTPWLSASSHSRHLPEAAAVSLSSRNQTQASGCSALLNHSQDDLCMSSDWMPGSSPRLVS